MFAGWSTASSGGGSSSSGGWSTGTSTATSGSGWSTGTQTTSGGGGGTWSFASPTVQPTSYPVYSYQISPYSYQASPASYALPGAGGQFGPYGEGGPYTPLDFPIMRELLPGERLEDLQGGGLLGKSALPYLALGVIAALLLKK